MQNIALFSTHSFRQHGNAGKTAFMGMVGERVSEEGVHWRRYNKVESWTRMHPDANGEALDIEELVPASAGRYVAESVPTDGPRIRCARSSSRSSYARELATRS